MLISDQNMNINHPHHAAHVRIGIISVAVLLTVAFHFLVAGRWFGLGLAVFAVLLVVGIHIVDVLAGKPNNTWAYIFLVPLIAVAAAECLYANTVVRLLSLPIMMVSSALFAYWFTAPRAGFWEAPVLWPATAIAETVWPFKGVGGMTAGLTRTEKARKVFLGLVIAAPVVIVIVFLFSGADAVFGKAVADIFDFKNAAENIYRTVRDVFVAVFFVASGWTIYTRISESRKAKIGLSSNAGDKTIITTFLAVLNLLFLVFIAFQAAVFFGGEKFVQAQGISYADYARQGFFQLLAVSGIVFVIMIAIYRWTHLREWGSRALGMALIVETGVIIVSAVRRLALYIDTYGLTLSRYWAMVVIIIIAAVLATLLVGALAKVKYETIIRASFIGLLVIFPMLLLVNVDGFIVKFNFDRFIGGKTDKFDAGYFLHGPETPSDTVPALVSVMRAEWPASSKVDPMTKYYLYNSLSYQQADIEKMIEKDWRNAVVSDYRALAAMGSLAKIDPNLLVPEKYVGDMTVRLNMAGTSGSPVFPKEIIGNLHATRDALANAKKLPVDVSGDVTVEDNYGSCFVPINHIGGMLKLVGGTVSQFESLPKTIGKDLDISQVNVDAFMPTGIDIGGAIKVSGFFGINAKGFVKDALSKGYRVVALNNNGIFTEGAEQPGVFAPSPTAPIPTR